MNPFTEKVVETILAIPPGRVMTYGQIAAEAGNPRGARQVVRILHALTNKYNLPWHRVVNVKGEIAIQDEEGRYTQAMRLREEGVQVSEDGRIELRRYLVGAAADDDGIFRA